jgi:deazaflavin-dependent oxidoreductase (nitroreductase family)
LIRIGKELDTMPTDQEFMDGNRSVIDEFRANDGVVASLGFPVLLMTTTGARTRRRTTVPLGFAVDSGRVFVVASKGGSPKHPAWFHNLRSNPAVTVELGRNSYQATARVAEGDERDRLFEAMKTHAPELRSFEQRVRRTIPVVVLEGVPPVRSPEGIGDHVSGEPDVSLPGDSRGTANRPS